MAKQKVKHMKRVAQHNVRSLANPAGTLRAKAAVMRRVPITYLPGGDDYAVERREKAMRLAQEDIRKAVEDAIAEWAAAELRVGQVLS